MQLHDIQPTTPSKSRKRVGRGGKRGTYSGRGVKGQKARAGRPPRPEIRDFLKRLPKLRGWKQQSRTPQTRVVNVGALQDMFDGGETVTIQVLEERGLIPRARRGTRAPAVKVLGGGELEHALTIADDIALSDTARAKIEEAGGTIAASA